MNGADEYDQLNNAHTNGQNVNESEKTTSSLAQITSNATNSAISTPEIVTTSAGVAATITLKSVTNSAFNRISFTSAKSLKMSHKETSVKSLVASSRAISKSKNADKSRLKIRDENVASTSKQSAALHTIQITPKAMRPVKNTAHVQRFANLHTCKVSNSFEILSDNENTQHETDMEVIMCSDDEEEKSVLKNKRKRIRKLSNEISLSNTDSQSAEKLMNLHENRPTLHIEKKKPVAATVKSVKMPVIVVTLNRDTVAALVRNFTSTKPEAKFQVKPSTIESRFYAEDHESHNALREYFRENNAPYYSHPVGGKEKLRVILSRCFDTDENEIIEALTNAGKAPIAVRKIVSAQNPKYGIDFGKGVTTLKDLQTNCSLMNHQRVKWELSVSKLKGPTVCYRCSMIGHGFADCTRELWCCYCAKNHSFEQCKFKNDPNMASCINCKLHGRAEIRHPANSFECPTALEYTRDRKEWREVNSPKKSPKPASFNINDTKWARLNPRAPQIAGTTPSQNSNNSENRSRPTINSESYASAARSRSAPRASSENYQASPGGEDLFDIGELFELMTEAIDQLKSAKSKLEQINICIGLLKKCL